MEWINKVKWETSKTSDGRLGRSAPLHLEMTQRALERGIRVAGTSAGSPMSSEDQAIDSSASQLEKKYVLQVYDSIASHFSETRYKPWPRVADFLLSLPPASLVYDVGCGNGKYFTVNRTLHMVGCDASANLLAICREKQMDSVVGEVQALPFRSDCADHFICIAVLHHLATESNRIAAISQLIRIVRPGGTGLIYVWAFEQDKVGSASNYTCKKKGSTNRQEDSQSEKALLTDGNIKGANDFCCSRTLSTLPVHESRTPFKQQDVLVPWKSKNSKDSFLRYYHVFKENELKWLCEKVPGVRVVDSFYDDGNWCVRLEKQVHSH